MRLTIESGADWSPVEGAAEQSFVAYERWPRFGWLT